MASRRPDGQDPPLLSWVDHPARQRPRAARLAVVYLAVVAAAVQLAWRCPWLTVLAAGLLLGAAGEFLWPSRYELTSRAVWRRGRFAARKLTWPEVRAVYVGEAGVRLSPLPRRSAVESFRGLFLPFGADRDRLLALIDELAVARVTRRATEGTTADA